MIPSANEIRVAGGTLDVDAHTVSIARFGGHGTVKGAGSVAVSRSLAFDVADLAAEKSLTLQVPVTLDAPVVVDILNTNLLDRAHGAYTVATAATPFAALPPSNLAAPWCLYLSNDGRTVKLHYRQGTMLLFR